MIINIWGNGGSGETCPPGGTLGDGSEVGTLGDGRGTLGHGSGTFEMKVKRRREVCEWEG
jgi:hypothetical protein